MIDVSGRSWSEIHRIAVARGALMSALRASAHSRQVRRMAVSTFDVQIGEGSTIEDAVRVAEAVATLHEAPREVSTRIEPRRLPHFDSWAPQPYEEPEPVRPIPLD